MNLTKINSERIKELIHNSLSYDVRGPAEDDKQIDTTDDVDLLLSELLALRVLAEDMAEALKISYDVECYPADGRTEQDIALAAYRVEYPEEK